MNLHETREDTLVQHECKLCGAVIDRGECKRLCRYDRSDRPDSTVITRTYRRTMTLVAEKEGWEA